MRLGSAEQLVLAGIPAAFGFRSGKNVERLCGFGARE